MFKIACSSERVDYIKLQLSVHLFLTYNLKSTRKCESWGYKLAFHFDPVVIYENCEKDYKEVIKMIFEHVSAENIVYISIGSFRFIPALKQIIKNRFTSSKIIYGEFVTGLDGKMRYFKPLRINIYREIINSIKELAPDVLLYFCMEDDEVWEKTLGFVPEEPDSLGKMLDKSVVKHCNLDASLLS